jgi:hypothetical protein
MSKKHVKLCVIIPVGPHNDGTDTVQSIQAYTTSSRRIIIVDDSGKASTRENLAKLGKDIILIKAKPLPGLSGKLWVKLAQAYQYAVENFSFDVLLRIDTDALVINSYPEEDAINYLKDHPEFGIIGSYKIDCNNQERSFEWAAKTLRKETGIRGLIHPRLRSVLRQLVNSAKLNGYVYGESCLGGAIFQSYSFSKQMYTDGWLSNEVFKDSNLEEDHIFGLIAAALGYKLGDFSTGNYPLGLRHKGLPDSPKNLLKRGKKIIHSIDYWEEMDELSIRKFFANQRTEIQKRKDAKTRA